MTTGSNDVAGRARTLLARFAAASKSAAKSASKVAEFAALALLLVLDFELAARFVVVPDGVPTNSLIVGALATGFVAAVVAALALARAHLPVVATVTSGFVVSLLASVVSAFTGSPWLTVTEIAALVVLTVFGVQRASSRGAIAVAAGALGVAIAAPLLRLGVDVGVVGVSSVGVDSTAATDGATGTAILLAVLIWGCAVVGGVAGRFLRQRRESALAATRRAERLELARELHDVVAHQVTGIVVQAQAAIAVARTDPGRAIEAFPAIEAAGAEALSGMRRMVGAIRDETAPGEQAPLSVPYGLADIPTLVDRFDPGHQRTTLHLEGADAPLPPGVGESAYRVVREALTNARKHAPKGNTAVSVRVTGAELVLEIENDGVRAGAGEPGSAGFGLTGISERVEALGGRMHAGPAASETWNVTVGLPLETTR